MNRVMFLFAVLAVFAMVSTAQATVLVTHVGSSNPTGESPAWTTDTNNGPTTSGGSDTEAYWQISGSSGYLEYDNALTADNVSGNWSATARVEAPTLSTVPTHAYLYVDNGSTRYGIGLTTTGLAYSTGAGTWSYLNSFAPSTTTYYDLELRNIAGTVTAYLDDGIQGVLTSPWALATTPHIGFGKNGGGTLTSVVNWNSVQFETLPVPEPSTLVLLSAGLIGLLCYAWRKRK